MALADTLTASLEDYLEAIFHIVAEKRAARPKDIASRLGVKNSSVTGALRSLAERKLINYAPYDVVTLTSTGESAAREIVRRHEVLRDFIMKVLSVEEAVADKATCRKEHFIDICPRGGAKWIAGFGYHCDHDSTLENCEKCVAAILSDIKQRKRQGGSKPMDTARLNDLRPGEKARVVKIRGRGEAKTRIVEMGVTPGTVVEIERIAPLGDPIDVKVKGYHLSLRKQEAEGIDVERLYPAGEQGGEV